jgi:hypothetical protein
MFEHDQARSTLTLRRLHARLERMEYRVGNFPEDIDLHLLQPHCRYVRAWSSHSQRAETHAAFFKRARTRDHQRTINLSSGHLNMAVAHGLDDDVGDRGWAIGRRPFAVSCDAFSNSMINLDWVGLNRGLPCSNRIASSTIFPRRQRFKAFRMPPCQPFSTRRVWQVKIQ